MHSRKFKWVTNIPLSQEHPCISAVCFCLPSLSLGERHSAEVNDNAVAWHYIGH